MNLFDLARTRVTLRSKINLLVSLDILLVLALVMVVFGYIIIKVEFDDKGQRALTEAIMVANMPQIIDAFQLADPSVAIQPIAEGIRKETGASFVVVGNMNLIRYSHPNPWQIGKVMVGNDDYQVLHGHTSITEAVGTLGLSVRGKAPIFDARHRQIGVVSVGFLVENIWAKIFAYLAIVAALGALGLVVGFVGAYLLSGHIKRQIYDMEPHEIALLTQEQTALLESIREGVLAVDINGKIITCNHEAKRLLELGSTNVTGKPVTMVVANSRLPEVLALGVSHFDQPMIVGNTLVVANRVPILLHGRVIGAVATFRDKMQLDQIDQRLADVGRYVDALRSQRHEFMNRLHTISGLIKIQEYDLARELIDQVNEEQQRVLEFFLARIRDPAVVGILMGKIHRANELGIDLVIDQLSRLAECSRHQELLVTVLGNAIENSFEALAGAEAKKRAAVVTVYLNDESERLLIRVSDSGPGIDPQLMDRILEDGTTTKGPGRGFGLSLLSRRLSLAGGELRIKSSGEGTILEAELPK